MGGGSRPSDSMKVSDQPSEKKKGLGDWMNLMKPVNEEKDHWVCTTHNYLFLFTHYC